MPKPQHRPNPGDPDLEPVGQPIAADDQSLVTFDGFSSTVDPTVRKAAMNHALILNLAIIGLIVVVLLVTSNALAMLGIVFLKEMPYGLLAPGMMEEEEETAGRPIGFIHPEE